MADFNPVECLRGFVTGGNGSLVIDDENREKVQNWFFQAAREFLFELQELEAGLERSERRCFVFAVFATCDQDDAVDLIANTILRRKFNEMTADAEAEIADEWARVAVKESRLNVDVRNVAELANQLKGQAEAAKIEAQDHRQRANRAEKDAGNLLAQNAGMRAELAALRAELNEKNTALKVINRLTV